MSKQQLQAKNKFIKKIFYSVLFIAIASLSYNSQLHCTEQKAPSKTMRTIKDVALAYTLSMFATAAHEAGHAAAIKLLYNESCAINVGAYWTSSSTLYHGPGFNIKYPLLPFGYVQFYSYGKDNLKDIAIFLSGPIMGSLASYIYLKILKKLYPNENDFEITKSCMQTEIWAQYLNLLPFPGSDGEQTLISLGKWLKS